MKASDYIPFHTPTIGEEEIQEVAATLRSGWLTTGPRTARFEADFSKFTEATHALAVNSATAGLHLALAALGIKAGDEVITTPLTFCSTVHSILHLGATPVLADIGPDLNINPESIRGCITPRTRAILPVHFAGLPCAMDSIWDMAREHNLFVVEDAAHAVGAHYKNHPIGSSTNPASDAVVFSFYATKNLTTGEGGMVVTPQETLAAELRTLALHGMSRDSWNRYAKEGSWYYEVVSNGFKYNLSDIQSAIGIHQLARVEEFTRIRTTYAQMYNEAFASLNEVEIPADRSDSRHAWHLYALRLKLDHLKINRADFIKLLGDRGIGCSVHFIPIPLHPYFAQLALSKSECPKALEVYPQLVSLPLYPAMTQEQVNYVITTVSRLIKESSKNNSIVIDKELPSAQTHRETPAEIGHAYGLTSESVGAGELVPVAEMSNLSRHEEHKSAATEVPGSVLAYFMQQRGRRIAQGCGRMWHSVEGGLLNSCPYHIRFSPDPEEMRELLRATKSKGARFPSMNWSGVGSGVYLHRAKNYDQDSLHGSFRRRVQKGLRILEVRPVTAEELREQGFQANLDTMSRQGRFDAEFGTRDNWSRLVDAVYNSPGVSAVGAFEGKNLAAYIILSREGGSMELLHQMSRADFLRHSPNHVLTFEVTRRASADPSLEVVSYGLGSLVKNSTLHEYKLHCGYEFSTHNSVVLLHPRFEFLSSGFIRGLVRLLRERRPHNQRLEKLEAVLQMAALSVP